MASGKGKGGQPDHPPETINAWIISSHSLIFPSVVYIFLSCLPLVLSSEFRTKRQVTFPISPQLVLSVGSI